VAIETPRILIVEDEEAHAQAIGRAFGNAGANVSIRVASTLTEYRHMLASDSPDIVLMDLNLPDGSALDILGSPEEFRPFPILIMTSHGNEQTAVDALKSGALDYVVKSKEAFTAMPHIVVRALREWDLLREQRRMVESLRVSEEKHRKLSQEFTALLDNLPDGISQISPELRVIWSNRSIKGVVKSDEAQLEGTYCYQVFCNGSKPCESCPVARSLQSGELVEVNMASRDGRFLELRAVPIIDESGMVESVIEIIRDITQHKLLEEQLRQAQKMESVGTLAGGIAHDFNNILTAIIGFGYIALMNMGQDDPQRKNVEHMLAGADRATQLTKDLLIFSRKQLGEKRPVELNEIVRKVEKFLARVIGEDINFTISLQNAPIVVQADTRQLEQVLMNLATNARDAMPGGGRLTISLEPIEIEKDFITIHGYGKPGSYALVTISDTGEGMDEETREKIFEPFFTTKVAGKGTGLGLAVVYGIIKQHDGYINVYSEPGSGTTFRIYLPLIPAEALEVETEEEEEIVTRGTETILLAEDEESVRELVSIVLKKHGYTVIEAVNGADAVNRFMENRDAIQLFVSDLIMPKMNGKEAYDEMRLVRPGMKAIFASGYAPDFVRQKVLLDSDVELISKPILPNILLKKIRSILDNSDK
jgi:two-component system, cell cycle sensor histidine kinase and response regulator CckA